MVSRIEADFFFGKSLISTYVAHTSNMSTMGERLRSARKAAGLSQAALGKLAGLSQRGVSQIERGETESTGHVVPLAAAVKVSPDWLETGRGPREPAVWSELVDLSKLPPDIKEDARRLFESVAVGDLPPARFRAAVIALLGDEVDG